MYLHCIEGRPEKKKKFPVNEVEDYITSSDAEDSVSLEDNLHVQ